MWVEVGFDGDLVAVLDGLGIRWQEAVWEQREQRIDADKRMGGWGLTGRIQVEVDRATDGRLEALVGRLAEVRWGYEPGRTLQLRLEGLTMPEVDNGFG